MLKQFSAALLLIILFISCNQKPEQTSRMPKQYSIQQLYNNVAVEAADFSTDETKVLVDNNSTGIFIYMN
jgi:hypothetical protein